MHVRNIKNIIANTSVGTKLVLLNLVMTILIPFIGGIFFRKHILTIYTVQNVNTAFVLEVVLCYVTYLFLLRNTQVTQQLNIDIVFKPIEKLIILYKKHRLIIAIIFSIYSVCYLFSSFNYYRYSGLHILDNDYSKFLIIGIVISRIIELDLIFNVIIKTFRKSGFLSSNNRIGTILFVISSYCFVGGTADILRSNIFLVLFIVSFSNKKGTGYYKILGLCLVVMMCSWFVGEIFKSTSQSATLRQAFNAALKESGSGVEIKGKKDKENIDPYSRIKELFLYLIERSSPHYYSSLYVAHLSFVDRINLSRESLASVLHGFLYRLNILTGSTFSYSRPTIGTICRLNYLNITKENFLNEKAGTSPGFLGSFSYILPFPISSIICAFCLLVLTNIFNGLVGNKNFDFKLACILYIFVGSFFDSPIDTMFILDPSLISLAGLYVMSKFMIQRDMFLKSKVS
jgi:hypothetical protein